MYVCTVVVVDIELYVLAVCYLSLTQSMHVMGRVLYLLLATLAILWNVLPGNIMK
jgi:hypothetical protein